jgi:hypothetical protein
MIEFNLPKDDERATRRSSNNHARYLISQDQETFLQLHLAAAAIRLTRDIRVKADYTSETLSLDDNHPQENQGINSACRTIIQDSTIRPHSLLNQLLFIKG